MSYTSLNELRSSQGLQARLIAAAAMEGIELPERWVNNSIWAIVSNQQWIDAWAYAEANKTVNQNQDTGARNDVITDAMILSAIQARVAATTPTTPPA